MKILFIGNYVKNREYIFPILKKKSKYIDLIDTQTMFFRKYKILNFIFYRLSPFFFEHYINNFILKKTKDKYDLIFVKSSEFISENLIKELKIRSKKIIAYIPDNPFVKRDKKRWSFFKNAAAHYDKLVFIQKSRIGLAKKNNLKNTYLVWPSFEQHIHKKHHISKIEKKRYKNEIVFIGTWFPERGKFFYKLNKLGLNIKIYGTRWKKDPNFEFMKKNITLGHVGNPKYSKIIQCSKISLCLPSKENMDDITIRNVEIPAIGTLLCAERTPEALKLLKENKEAIYFKDVKECFDICNTFLNNKKNLKKVSGLGYIKIRYKLKNNFNNTLNRIIKETFR